MERILCAAQRAEPDRAPLKFLSPRDRELRIQAIQQALTRPRSQAAKLARSLINGRPLHDLQDHDLSDIDLQVAQQVKREAEPFSADQLFEAQIRPVTIRRMRLPSRRA